MFAIHEAHDITKMEVDELIESLLTYEMSLKVSHVEKKTKGIAFKASNCDSISHNTNVSNDVYDDTTAMLAKKILAIKVILMLLRTCTIPVIKLPNAWKVEITLENEGRMNVAILNRPEAREHNVESVKSMEAYTWSALIIWESKKKN